MHKCTLCYREFLSADSDRRKPRFNHYHAPCSSKEGAGEGGGGAVPVAFAAEQEPSSTIRGRRQHMTSYDDFGLAVFVDTATGNFYEWYFHTHIDASPDPEFNYSHAISASDVPEHWHMLASKYICNDLVPQIMSYTLQHHRASIEQLIHGTHLCRYALQNVPCRRGPACRYNHDTQNIECKYGDYCLMWQQGKGRCHFKHTPKQQPVPVKQIDQHTMSLLLQQQQISSSEYGALASIPKSLEGPSPHYDYVPMSYQLAAREGLLPLPERTISEWPPRLRIIKSPVDRFIARS